MGFDIEAFSIQFDGGARAYLFEYAPNIKGIAYNEDNKIYVKATSLPSTSIEEHMIEYQGINYKMGGKKTFEDWTVTFNLDKDGQLRKDFEAWTQLVQEIKEDGTMIHKYPSNYVLDQYFYMLGTLDIGLDPMNLDISISNEPKILEIKLYNAWPKSISPISLDYSSQDFAQFDVTFSYLYHIIV